MTLRRSILLVLLVLIPLAAWSAPPKPRPYSGSELLIIRPLFPERSTALAAIPLYRTPGVGRIRTMAPGDLPDLAAVMTAASGEVCVAVMGTKGPWLKVAYDGAGHEGWIQPLRSWRQRPWKEYLPGRSARLLPGLQKGYYALFAEPDAANRGIATLSRQESFAIVRVTDDWALVTAGKTTGWLRWRDADGRFLITVGDAIPPQNH